MTGSSEKYANNMAEKSKVSSNKILPITNDVSLDWMDSHLQNFITMKFPELDLQDEVNIACQFLTYLFCDHISPEISAPRLLFITASFLRSPRDPKDRLIGIFDSDVPVKNFPICFVYRADIFLDHLLRKKFDQDLSDRLFRESLMSIRGNGIVAYASFLANACLCTSVRTPESVYTYLTEKSTSKFNDWFSMYKLNGAIPVIPFKIIQRFIEMSLGSHWLFLNYFSYVLETYKATCNDKLIEDYLFDLILAQTMHHGLRLIKDYGIVKKKYRIDATGLQKFVDSNKAKKSLELLKEFDRKYGNGESILWPWARMLKANYFFEFRPKYHLDLELILSGLVEPYEGTAVWDAMFFDDVTADEKLEAKESAENIIKKLKTRKIGK